MWIYILLFLGILVVIGVAVAVRRQSAVTASYSRQAQEEDARIIAKSTKAEGLQSPRLELSLDSREVLTFRS